MKKELGQIFTPYETVCFILDEVGYKEKNVLHSKIIEPSFGEGVFLLEIINRIINATKKLDLSKTETEKIIKENVFGIEIDTTLYNKAILNINNLLKSYGLSPDILNNNLFNDNTLSIYPQFQNSFDYVVGNPPYVRVKNLPNEIRQNLKSFSFTTGTTDLYIAFFEIAFHLISDSGKISFITPNSFLYNTSQQMFRKFLFENKYIEKIFNYEDIHIFSNANIRTCISVLSKGHNDFFYYSSSTENNSNFQTNIKCEDMNYKQPQYLSEKDAFFIKENQSRCYRLKDFINVQNGIATNKDDVYIKLASELPDIESILIYPCIKASRCDSDYGKKNIILPYISEGTGYIPMTEKQLADYPLAYNYFLQNKTALKNRDMEKNTEWFLFARSQGLKTLNQEKIVLKHIFSNNDNTVYAKLLPASYFVYSGLFITAKNTENKSLILKNVLGILSSPDFCKYAKMLGRKKRGNYIEITAEIIKNYGVDKLDFV